MTERESDRVKSAIESLPTDAREAAVASAIVSLNLDISDIVDKVAYASDSGGTGPDNPFNDAE